MPERIIQIVKRDNQIRASHAHIAEITGERYVKKPHYYRNIQNGQEYSHLAGGIGWPGERPGFVAVVAVERETETFHVLAEAQGFTVKELLSECIRMRGIYGYGQGDLFRFWYGDNERFATFVSDFNHRLERSNPKAEGIHLSPPYDSDKQNALEVWLNRIHACLTKDSGGKKSLYLGACDQIRNAIQNLPHDAAYRGSVEDYPAITCLGGLVHSLMILRPWMDHIKSERPIPTVQDNYEAFAHTDHERTMRALFGNDAFGEPDEYDSGQLLETVDVK